MGRFFESRTTPRVKDDLVSVFKDVDLVSALLGVSPILVLKILEERKTQTPKEIKNGEYQTKTDQCVVQTIHSLSKQESSLE